MRFALGMLWSCAFLSARAGNLSVEFLHSGHAADIVEQWQCQQPCNPTAGTQGNKERPRPAAIYLCRNSVLVQDNFSQCQDTATSLPRRVCNSRHFYTKSFYSCRCRFTRMWLKVFKLRMNAQQQQKLANIFLATCSCFSFDSALPLTPPFTVLGVYRGMHSAILSTFGPRIN